MRRRRLDRPNALAALPTKLVSWNLNGECRCACVEWHAAHFPRVVVTHRTCSSPLTGFDTKSAWRGFFSGLARRVDDEGWKEFTREMIRLDPDVMALQEVKALLPSALSMAPTKP